MHRIGHLYLCVYVYLKAELFSFPAMFYSLKLSDVLAKNLVVSDEDIRKIKTRNATKIADLTFQSNS